MLEVGLTGNIAAGKSSVVRVWRERGAFVVDADELARRVVEPGTPGLRRIVEHWGEGVLDAEGRLDRAALRDRVFRDAEDRARLEAIVHPAVADLRDREFERARQRGEAVVVADIPLLFEIGMQSRFDLVVLVDAPESVRLERLIRDRGLDPVAAGRMIRAQMPAARKRAEAHFVIENDGSPEALERQAERVWSELLRRSREAGEGSA